MPTHPHSLLSPQQWPGAHNLRKSFFRACTVLDAVGYGNAALHCGLSSPTSRIGPPQFLLLPSPARHPGFPCLAFLTGFHYASQAAVESSCLCSVRALGLHLHLEVKIHIQLSRQQAHFGHPTDTTSTCWKLETESTIPSLSFPSFQPPNSPSREARRVLSKSLPGKQSSDVFLCLIPVTTGQPTSIT